MGKAAVQELYSTKQEVDRMRVAASNATKAAETDKRNAEQAAQAKLSKVEAEVTAAKIQCRELTASRDQLRLGVTPLLSTVRKLAAQNSANRVAIAGLDEQQAADVKAMDDVLKNHTIKGSSDVNEQEEEILALQKELRRVEREVWFCQYFSIIAGFQGGNLQASSSSTCLTLPMALPQTAMVAIHMLDFLVVVLHMSRLNVLPLIICLQVMLRLFASMCHIP